MKSIKAKLSKFASVEEYIQGWGPYYYGAGILIPTRKVQEPGTIVALHIEIASGEPVLRGEGVVEEIRTNPDGAPVGLVVRFTRLDARSKELTQQILAHKRETRDESSAYIAAPTASRDEALPPGSADDLGAIAEEFDETFDKIFATGSFGALTDDSAARSAAEEASSGSALDPPAPSAATEAPEPPLGASGSAEPTQQPSRATKAVTQALAGLGIAVPDEVAAADPVRSQTPPAPETRVRDFISGAVEAASGAHAALRDEPERGMEAAAALAARYAAEGEEALDQLVADASSSQSASSNLVPVTKPGLVARFFAWLRSLFGGH